MSELALLFVVACGLLVSFLIAHMVGRGGGSWAFGLLGPLGWILAAIVGVQRAVQQRAAAPAPKAEAEFRRRICPHCKVERGYPATASAFRCRACGEHVTLVER